MGYPSWGKWGALELSKCSCHLMVWTFAAEGDPVLIHAKQPTDAPLQIVDPLANEVQALHYLSPYTQFLDRRFLKSTFCPSSVLLVNLHEDCQPSTMVEKQRPRSGSRFSLNPLTAAVLDAIPPLGYKRPPPLIGHETVTNSHRLLRAKTTLTRTSTPVLRIGTLISRSVSNSSIVQQSILHSATPKRRTRKISALGDTKDYIWRITLQLNNT